MRNNIHTPKPTIKDGSLFCADSADKNAPVATIQVRHNKMNVLIIQYFMRIQGAWF
jgi:hypothetical protein